MSCGHATAKQSSFQDRGDSEVIPPTVINRPRNDRVFLLGFVGGEVEIIQS